MASRTIDNRAVSNVFTIVDENGPKVDEDEQDDVGELLQREEQREEMIRHRLSPTVHRMEGV